jgi:hypothetical protein
MRRTIYCVFGLLIMLIWNASIIAQGVDPGTQNLRHSWTFNDGTANDYVGGANGTLMGGANVVEGTLSLDADQWMEMPADVISLNTYDEITLEIWFRPFSNANPTYHMIAVFGNTNADNGLGIDYYFMTPARQDDKSRTAIAIGNYSAPYNAESGADGPELDDGELHHMVSTLTNAEIALYIDGQLATAPANQSQGPTPLSATNTIQDISPALAYLGKSNYTSDATWQGEILEFNVYDKALSADNILFLYQKGPSTATGVEDRLGTMPKKYSLLQNYPNPFNPTTVIGYQLPATSNVSLKVYNLLGEEVAILVEGIRQPGTYQATFDGSKLASGVYLYRMTANNFVETKKLVLVR